MQVKNQWENAKLIVLHNKASIDDGSWFFYASQIKQKLFIKVVTYVGDCYCYCYCYTGCPKKTENYWNKYIVRIWMPQHFAEHTRASKLDISKLYA
jgi:hypothetical protein